MGNTLEPGIKAPGFSLPDSYENSVSIDQFSGKWKILYFYPKDSTSGCTAEAIDFTSLRGEFEKMNAVIIGISPDSCKSHQKFSVAYDLGITLLSDEDKKVCTAYGVWQLKKRYGREYNGVVRTTFLINPEGVIVQVWNSVSVKDHAQKVLDALKDLSDS